MRKIEPPEVSVGNIGGRPGADGQEGGRPEGRTTSGADGGGADG